MFTSGGVRGSWDRLGEVLRGVHIWGDLSQQLNNIAGVPYRSTTHVEPDTSPLVRKVAAKAQEWGVLVCKHGRKKKGGLTKDCLKEGLEILCPDKGETHGRFATFLRDAISFVLEKRPLQEETDEVACTEVSRPVIIADSNGEGGAGNSPEE